MRMVRRVGARGERGASALEYLGLALVAGVVCAAIALFLVPDRISVAARDAWCQIVSASQGCSSDASGPGSEDPTYGGMGSAGEDPGDDVELPEGLDADSEIAKNLMSTARGRRTLQWLHDNGIEIVVDPGATGAFYSDGTITLGPGFDDGGTVVHEANHAQYDVEERHADVKALDRDTYVHDAIAEEAQGVWLEVVYAKERRDGGETEAVSGAEKRYDGAFQQEYDNRIGAGESKADAWAAANRAGQAAIEEMFYDGTFVTSTNGKSYPDYYGDYWDSAH